MDPCPGGTLHQRGAHRRPRASPGLADADQSGLVQSAIARWEVIGVQDTETLDTVDRVVALQRVPMFAGIDPEDLERIATLHRTSL